MPNRKSLTSVLLRSARSVVQLLGASGRPDFLIIGAQKAGTSALFSYLAQHPRFLPARRKEIGYFSPEAFVDWPTHPSAGIMRALHSGALAFTDRAALRWYHDHFPLRLPGRRGRLFYEASPDYLYFAKCAERIRRYDPNIKVIALLRDPVERAYSAWNMFRGFTGNVYGPLRERRSFEEAIEEELSSLDQCETLGTDYVRRGLYHAQVQRYVAHFPASQLLILSSAELRDTPDRAVAAVCGFLGVPTHSAMAYPRIFRGTYSSAMPESSRSRLSKFYAPHNEALFQLIGHRWDWT